MNDDKIIDFSKKSIISNDNLQKSFFSQFQSVKISRDENGISLKEDYLRDYAEKCFYIVSVMKNNGTVTSLYKYKVPYKFFVKFIKEIDKTSFGEIIDIEKYIPKEPA